MAVPRIVLRIHGKAAGLPHPAAACRPGSAGSL
jgi:hypothetical protein